MELKEELLSTAGQSSGIRAVSSEDNTRKAPISLEEITASMTGSSNPFNSLKKEFMINESDPLTVPPIKDGNSDNESSFKLAESLTL